MNSTNTNDVLEADTLKNLFAKIQDGLKKREAKTAKRTIGMTTTGTGFTPGLSSCTGGFCIGSTGESSSSRAWDTAGRKRGNGSEKGTLFGSLVGGGKASPGDAPRSSSSSVSASTLDQAHSSNNSKNHDLFKPASTPASSDTSLRQFSIEKPMPPASLLSNSALNPRSMSPVVEDDKSSLAAYVPRHLRENYNTSVQQYSSKPLSWDKPSFGSDYFSSKRNASGNASESVSRKRKIDESSGREQNADPLDGFGTGLGFGPFRRAWTKEEVDSLLAFADKWIPTDGKRRKMFHQP